MQKLKWKSLFGPRCKAGSYPAHEVNTLDPPVGGTFFLLALAADFKCHGPEAIAKVRKQQPAAYLKVCALLVPREMKFEHSGGVKAMTDEQLERSIELIQEMIAKREAGANAKVIEGESEVVPSASA
jgi:hypothetical protein